MASTGVDREGDSTMASPPSPSSPSSPSSPLLSSSSSAEQRQRAIWSSRVRRELDKCRPPSPSSSSASSRSPLPPGVSLRSARVDEAAGRCSGEFHCFVPLPEGSDALALVPLTVLVVSMPFSARTVARGDAQFPFRAPTVEVRAGGLYLPPDMLAREKPRLAAPELVDEDEDEDEDEEEEDSGFVLTPRPGGRRWLLRLPLLERWSPSNTLLMVLEQFVALVQQSDPQPTSAATQTGAKTPAKKPQMRMRRRDVHGTVYPAQEVDPATSSLVARPMLLQSNSLALLVAESLVPAADDPFVYVVELIALRDVARITPQRGKSLTLFFKDHKLPCRTFLTVHTDAVLADIRRMVAASSAGAKRGRDDHGNGSALSNLLPFLSTEQTEKAKEVSSKLMNRLGKYANSMSRFLRGEDEASAGGSHEPAAAGDPLARAFAEIEEQKAAFFRTPSRARMTEITRRYQHIAEHFAHQDSREGHVERAIEELQAFIEHPKTQRILLETCEYEQMNKGIRVGPA